MVDCKQDSLCVESDGSAEARALPKGRHAVEEVVDQGHVIMGLAAVHERVFTPVREPPRWGAFVATRWSPHAPRRVVVVSSHDVGHEPRAGLLNDGM